MDSKDQVKSQAFWKQLWKENPMDFQACEEFWDKRAGRFQEDVLEKHKNTDRLLIMLKEKGMYNYASSILDIGCGPGTHAIPLAKKTREVVALDISQGMLDILEKQAKEENLDNLTTLKCNWVDLSLEKMAWENRFDLVFASMSPAIHNFETLEKMCQASRGFCYLSAWVKRTNKIEDALLASIGGGKKKSGILEDKIYYAFNILWNLGYQPEVTYSQRKWSGYESTKDAYENYISKLSILSEITENDREAISKKLEEFDVDGRVLEETEAVVGSIIWKVR